MKSKEVIGIILVVIGILIIIDLLNPIFNTFFSFFSAELIIGIIFILIGITVFQGKENKIEKRKDQKTKK